MYIFKKCYVYIFMYNIHSMNINVCKYFLYCMCVFIYIYIYIYIYLHLHLVILQTLLSKATYNWGIHKAIHLEEANRQRKCPNTQSQALFK